MLITKAKAEKELKARTGRSQAWCRQQVKKLATVADGKLDKLHDHDLESLIHFEQIGGSAATRKGVRGMSLSMQRKIAEQGI